MDGVTKMKLFDIKDMPDFNPVVKNNINSVSKGRVYLSDEYSYKITPTCYLHGAINLVAIHKTGKLWRCLICNEGCFEGYISKKEVLRK